jgi:predicted kinase
MLYIIPVGISGAGKSFLGNKIKEKFSNVEIICMDDIRKELTGNISDQSKNKQVYNKSQELIVEALKNKKSVYESATNLTGGKKNLIQKIQKIKEKFPSVKPVIVFLTDSLNPDGCLSRVIKDLENNIDRSNTPKDIIARQFQQFKEIYDASFLMERPQFNLDVLKFGANTPVEGFLNTIGGYNV